MRIAVVWSSPNENGLTATAKNSFITGLGEGVEVEEIALNQLNLEACRACGNGWGTCSALGSCVIQDDFMKTYEKLVQADGIVFVTAVYWAEMTEQMKKFMDRMRRCDAIRNHYLNGKRCVVVACAGGSGNGAIECLLQMERTLNHMGMRAWDRLPVNRHNRSYMIPALQEAGSVYAARLQAEPQR